MLHVRNCIERAASKVLILWAFLRAVFTNVRFFSHSMRLFWDWGDEEASRVFGYPESVVDSLSPGPKTILFYYYRLVVP